MDSLLPLGILGMALILVAFLLGQKGIWRNDSVAYDLMNCVGSFLLVAYAIAGRSYPFIVLNAIWGLYSLHDVVADLCKRHDHKRAWMFWRR